MDAELAENSILGMKEGKAAGIDHLTTEHLLFVCLFVCLLFYGTPAPLGPLVPREV